MPTIKHKDWSGWWDGVRSKMMKAGAEALSTNLTALLGTNGVDALNIPGLDGIGMSWKTAVATMLIQFVLRSAKAGSDYIRDNPDPAVITETVETTHITKDSVGTTEIGSSKTTTTTPVETKKD